MAAIAESSAHETFASISPNDCCVVFAGTRRSLLLGLTASAVGAISYAITTSISRTLNVASAALPGAGSRVMRGGATNTSVFNILPTGSGPSWSFLRRARHYKPHSFNTIQVLIPLFTSTTGGSIQELDLPEAYDFAVSFEFPFTESLTNIPTNTRYRFTFNHATVLCYTLGGQTLKYALSDKLELPFTVPGNTAFGTWTNHECVAGRSGAVSNKQIQDASQLSAAFAQRFEGFANTSTSQIASDAVMTATSVRGFTTTAPQGGNYSMGPGAILTSMPSETLSIYIDENSIGAGNQEGYGASDGCGDATGDLHGNRGYVMRLAQKLGLEVVQGSKGSDGWKNRNLPGAYTGRLQVMAVCKPTHYWGLNPHNDIGVGTAATPWAADAAVAQYDTRWTASGQTYIASTGGTTGTTGPVGAGLAIRDGSVVWIYLGENDLSTSHRAGGGFVSGYVKYLLQVRAALPHATIIIPTESPHGKSQRAASAYRYVGTTMTLTLANVADLQVGQGIRISGLSPAHFNVSTSGPGVPITAIDTENKTISYTVAPGLAAPTGTAIVDTGQGTTSDYAAGNGYAANISNRSWINRFLRGVGVSVLSSLVGGKIVIFDLGKYTEQGAPLTPAAETGQWKILMVGGIPLTAGESSDGTHPTSRGYDDVATQAAADTRFLKALGAFA